MSLTYIDIFNNQNVQPLAKGYRIGAIMFLSPWNHFSASLSVSRHRSSVVRTSL